eukprot:1143054-Prorocentrum_minimum.AAC.3
MDPLHWRIEPLRWRIDPLRWRIDPRFRTLRAAIVSSPRWARSDVQSVVMRFHPPRRQFHPSRL